MSHWFDRLAARSVENEEGGGELQLTRRQAVRVAGIGTAGLLGGPLAGKAMAISSGEGPECQCWDKAIRINKKANSSILGGLGGLVLTPAGGIVAVGAILATTSAFLGHVVHCGLCRDDPPLEPPPPKFQPCTQRGGLRLRGEQCGGPPAGGGGGAEGGSGCGGGTSSCPTPGGGDLCCFGTDLCCSGCCCIAEVGCGCCG